MYRELAPEVAQAVETIKQASVLVEAYLEGVKQLSAPNPLAGTSLDVSAVEREGLLLSMDQNYSALWAKLDEARGQLRLGGLEAAEYDGLRARVGNATQGYQEEHKVEHGLTSVRYESRWWIERDQVDLPVQALAALKRLLPGVDWEVRLDAEAEAFVRGQQRGRWLWRASIVGAFVVGVAVLIWGFCR
jgi:hypothetical protein